MINQDKIIVGISIGDLNGIGPEVALKSLSSDLLEQATIVFFANILDIQKLASNYNPSLQLNLIESLDKRSYHNVNVINCWDEPFQFNLGACTLEAGEKAIQSLTAAVQALKKDQIDVLVTAPINKQNIQSETFNFPGHTNYIASELNQKALMFMVHDTLKVGLITDHVPLNKVTECITPSTIESKALKIKTSLQTDFNIASPKIAVLSINPHVGDNGVIGNEDQELLIPTLERLNKNEPYLYGPFPADSFFGAQRYKQFDAILASYHDQGLIPFKALSFGNGVNFTAGLSKIRTSPDHGTAYDIAGKDIANESSFKAAIMSGLSIYRNRENINKKM